MPSVFDVARYIINKTGSITAMKLQKLVYYCQAWSLVWDEKPLFKEDIQAWANGPVVRELFEAHRGEFMVDKEPNGNIEHLNENHQDTIDNVLAYYGDKSSQWLSDLTHMEDPWKNARKEISDEECGTTIITHSELFNYYSTLPAEISEE